MKRLAALATGLVIALAASLEANQIGYIEDFALAKDRAEALQRATMLSECTLQREDADARRATSHVR